MRENDVDRALIRLGERDHFAKGTTMIIGGTARLREDPDGLSAMILHPALGSGNLIRQR
ncbi:MULTISPECIES: hypothetical protein [unclassified Sphingomonas]|uniref:hypothetical protein n=1 Tax=Sphingomonas sp. WG TaxID=1592629 RepID=UPI00178C5880|nr:MULTISPECIES: hypothetical protein [unclassified Sphingomonas]